MYGFFVLIFPHILSVGFLFLLRRSAPLLLPPPSLTPPSLPRNDDDHGDDDDGDDDDGDGDDGFVRLAAVLCRKIGGELRLAGVL